MNKSKIKIIFNILTAIWVFLVWSVGFRVLGLYSYGLDGIFINIMLASVLPPFIAWMVLSWFYKWEVNIFLSVVSIFLVLVLSVAVNRILVYLIV